MISLLISCYWLFVSCHWLFVIYLANCSNLYHLRLLWKDLSSFQVFPILREDNYRQLHPAKILFWKEFPNDQSFRHLNRVNKQEILWILVYNVSGHNLQQLLILLIYLTSNLPSFFEHFKFWKFRKSHFMNFNNQVISKFPDFKVFVTHRKGLKKMFLKARNQSPTRSN